MESNVCPSSTEPGSPEQLPSLFKQISTEVVFGFDTTPSPRTDPAVENGPEAASIQKQVTDISITSPSSPMHPTAHSRHHSISISMPSSPSALNIEQTRSVRLLDDPVTNSVVGQPGLPPKTSRFYSQPIQSVISQDNKVTLGKSPNTPQGTLRNNRLKDKRFDSFKTFSGKLERQISTFRGRPQIPDEVIGPEITESEDFPAVHRYFDALEGPELETLKAVRINFFRGFRFSLAWWAYTFPMTGAAIATIRYSGTVNNWLTKTLSVVLSLISTLTVSALLLSTIYHAFVLRDLFPNDISIAIKGKRPPKSSKKHSRQKTASSDGKDLEAGLSI